MSAELSYRRQIVSGFQPCRRESLQKYINRKIALPAPKEMSSHPQLQPASSK